MARAKNVDGFVLENVEFSHQGTNRITSHQDWRDILAPGKMMTNKILGTVLTVSIYGHSKELQSPTSLSKTCILNEYFWNKWHKVNTQEEASDQRWVYLEEEPVWGNEVLRQEIEVCLLVDERQRNKKSLSLSLEELSSLDGNRFTTDEFIRGQVGFYTILQEHECARMITKARPPVRLYFLDHMIIPIHVGNTYWFPAHLDIKKRQMTFLDSQHSYCSKCHVRHELFIWRFYRMAWERHVAKEFPPPNWFLSPADCTRPDNWLPGITPGMTQALKTHQKLTVQVVAEVESDFIINKWKRQGICLWQEDFFLDTSRQNLMGRSQPSQMPQQDSFHNHSSNGTGMWILFSFELNVCSQKLEVRFWPTGAHCRGTDFDQQEHIAGVLLLVKICPSSTMGQIAGEAVSLEFCEICKDSYTKWKHCRIPQCGYDSEGAGACPIMCTSPTVLPALRLQSVKK